jgi:cell division protease FtsH
MEAGGVRDVVAKTGRGIKQGDDFHIKLQSWLDAAVYEQLVQRYLTNSKRLVFKPRIIEGEDGLSVVADDAREETELDAGILGQGLVSRPRVSFADVAGADNAKRRLMEIVDWINHPRRLKALGVPMPKGVLLYGKPGTGKTLLAKAVAGEAGLPFLVKTGSEFMQTFVGQGGRAVRELFEAASEYAPCILFIDEIDAIGRRNTGSVSGTTNAEKEVVNQLLACMDGFAADTGVFVIAATNYPDSLDAALLRPGRFDNKIEVGLPNREGRRAILGIHAGKAAIDADVNLDEVVRLTPGFSGAMLAQVIKEGGFLALRNERDAITQADLLEAVNTVMAGMALSDLKQDPADVKRTAIHESGHAIAGHLLEPHKKLVQLTIMPRANTLGFAQHEDDEAGDSSLTEQELINRVKVLLAGRAAEALMLPDAPRSTGASNDLERASSIIVKMLIRYGMLERKWQGYSAIKEIQLLPESLMLDVNCYIEQFEQEVMKDLKAHKVLLTRFSDVLLEKETLDQQQIASVLN